MSVFVVLSACVDDDTSIPQPQPVPAPLRSMIRTSTADENQESMVVVGLAGAVDGAGKVHVIDARADSAKVVLSGGSGSFSAVVSTTRRQDISLRFEDDRGESEVVELGQMQWRGVGLTLEEAHYNGPIVSGPDADGNVVVSNETAAGQLLIAASPNVDVVVGNSDNGEVVVDKTDARGAFSVTIAAATGDTIQVMLISPKSIEETSDFLEFKVP